MSELAFSGKCLSSSNIKILNRKTLLGTASSHGNLKFLLKSYCESEMGNSMSPLSKERCTAMERGEAGLDSL